eukprot:3197922-Rhodomonas_salina.1
MDAFADYESDEDDEQEAPSTAAKEEVKEAEKPSEPEKKAAGTKRKLPSAASMLASGAVAKPSFLHSEQKQNEIE